VLGDRVAHRDQFHGGTLFSAIFRSFAAQPSVPSLASAVMLDFCVKYEYHGSVSGFPRVYIARAGTLLEHLPTV
jgi:hypothetical protein